MSQRKLRLGAFIMATGHHVAAWRHPGSQVDSGVNIDHYIEVARTAERGLFDQVFVADTPGVGFHPWLTIQAARWLSSTSARTASPRRRHPVAI